MAALMVGVGAWVAGLRTSAPLQTEASDGEDKNFHGD